MNGIINKFLLTGYTFMPEMHLLRQFGFTYSACGPYTNKTKKEFKNLRYIYQQEI